MKHRDHSTEHTIHLDNLEAFAKEMAQKLQKGDWVCLVGDMGSGKTTLSYFLTQHWLGQKPSQFSSPTFAILNQYVGDQGFVNHIDLYRLNQFDEVLDLDVLSELENPHSLSLVEWGDRFVELKPKFSWRIELSLIEGEPETRHISVTQMRG